MKIGFKDILSFQILVTTPYVSCPLKIGFKDEIAYDTLKQESKIFLFFNVSGP
jgi:hypothetical protein